VLRSAAEIVLDDPRALDELDVCLEAIKDATRARNDCVHGSWCIRHSDKTVLLVQEEARTHVVASYSPVTVDQIESKALALYEAGMDLMRFIMAVDKIPALPRERKRGINTPKARKAARKKNGK
ncbi:MAG TPA: hypothetical protein VFK50_06330, partial [Sphingomicrobium sp.]|nr:hypothetical protein [Sphingomicrobium sp.]